MRKRAAQGVSAAIQDEGTELCAVAHAGAVTLLCACANDHVLNTIVFVYADLVEGLKGGWMARKQAEGVEEIEFFHVWPNVPVLANVCQIANTAERAREPFAVAIKAVPHCMARGHAHAVPDGLQRRTLRFAQTDCDWMAKRCELVVHKGW